MAENTKPSNGEHRCAICGTKSDVRLPILAPSRPSCWASSGLGGRPSILLASTACRHPTGTTIPKPIMAAAKEIANPTIIDQPHPVVNSVPSASSRSIRVRTTPLNTV